MGREKNANVIHERGALAYTLIWTTEPSIYIHKLSHIPNPLINQISAAKKEEFFFFSFSLLSAASWSNHERHSCVLFLSLVPLRPIFQSAQIKSVERWLLFRVKYKKERSERRFPQVLFNFWPRRFENVFYKVSLFLACIQVIQMFALHTNWKLWLRWQNEWAARIRRGWKRRGQTHKFQISSFSPSHCVCCVVAVCCLVVGGIWVDCETWIRFTKSSWTSGKCAIT